MVTPNILWRGSKPDQDGATWLIQHGVATIVNPELIHDDEQVLDRATPTPEGDRVIEVGYFRVRDWDRSNWRRPGSSMTTLLIFSR